mmetsp:Transcript_8434/g.20742  ORF Transcript_8434/g.20742 Transcript_8434/m.20742 type:complete len:83 (-) Transcript_8434:27-275(-)
MPDLLPGYKQTKSSHRLALRLESPAAMLPTESPEEEKSGETSPPSFCSFVFLASSIKEIEKVLCLVQGKYMSEETEGLFPHM